MKVLINRKPVSGPWGGGNKTVSKLSSALKNIASQRRNNQIIKNMLKLEQLNAMKEQAILKSRSVVVDRDTRCQKCGHPFTARSVPAVFPDMSIYHVACSVESDEYEGY